MAQEKIDPRGQWRTDMGFAQICALLANIHRDPKKPHIYSAADFMPSFEPPKVMTEQEAIAHYKAMFDTGGQP